ncbi:MULTISPECIES: type II toxin-antitoxin system RelE/ParE family toxin [Nocardiopsis]|uniref:type II toxin-antitoxin system RelE family toxin n=1 Tax=Nocardiopsis TaxID=2013 RepID=UPI0003782640|nr:MULTISPECIES: type II toxin-antitoxin system RelE/ParE family toxin [Nocardiopsis]ASU57150.1 type II toxin-antitoxin system mRNA interferase toxin, RelE/StbE family [Nocardiopsis dassonvillei]
MSRYAIDIKASARKELRKLDGPVRKRIVEAVANLADNPRPDGCKKLTARDGYRIRVGDYRVVYTVDDGQITVVVVKVGARGDVYGR